MKAIEVPPHGYIYAPYIPIALSDYYDKRAKHVEIYNDNHKCCPNCNGTSLSQTLVGYVFNVSKPEEYKDENRATCQACGWVGIVHDMKPL